MNAMSMFSLFLFSVFYLFSVEHSVVDASASPYKIFGTKDTQRHLWEEREWASGSDWQERKRTKLIAEQGLLKKGKGLWMGGE